MGVLLQGRDGLTASLMDIVWGHGADLSPQAMALEVQGK